MNTKLFPVASCWSRFLLVCLLSTAGLPAFAQVENEADTYETRKRLSVGVTKYADARKVLSGFIQTYALRVQKQEETPEQLTAEFSVPVRTLPHLDSLAASLGYVLENNLNSSNLAPRQQELEADAQQETAAIAQEQGKLQAANLPKEEWVRLQQEQERHEVRLRRIRQQQQVLSSHVGQAYVTLRLFDEISFPTGNRRVSFVNMPGVEVGYLRLDNPKPGLTSQAYRGYAIKYLFTRGKSYFNLGVYKPTTTNKSYSAFVNELFVVNFGQDFYPRNFGRGRRRYLNLYTSYQIGGFILNRNDDKTNDFIPNVNLGLGVELIKTRHILLDTKASYFVPLNSRSRDLRGVLGQASFNFVF